MHTTDERRRPEPFPARPRPGGRAAARPHEPPEARLPRLLGNHAYGQLLQAKLRVGAPDDAYEREADRLAEQAVAGPIVQPPAPQLLGGRPAVLPGATDLRRQHGAPGRQEPGSRMSGVRPSPGVGTPVPPGVAGRIDARRGAGRPLPQADLAEMGTRMGTDFSGTRIHTDAEAAGLNRALGARAFTLGRNIYFDRGQYAPHTHEGKRLLAHELVHVQQQTSTARATYPAGRVVQRDLPALGAPAPAGAAERLASEDRDWLTRRIEHRLLSALMTFVDACNEHQRSLRTIAAQQAQMVGVVLDVVLAFATPGLGRLVTAGISRAVPAGASESVYRVALGALARSDQITAAATAVGKQAITSGVEGILSRERTEQFVQDLKQEMRVAVDRVHGTLRDRTDEELAILYFNYDPEIATYNYYERRLGTLISQYESQVAPIGQRTAGAYGPMKARWVEGTHWRALALTGEGRYYLAGRGPEFITWISPAMREMAVRASERGGYRVATVHYADLEMNAARSGTAWVFSRLDSPDRGIRDCGIVAEAATGVRPRTGATCPGCHGEPSTRPAIPSPIPEFEPRWATPPPNLVDEAAMRQLREWIQSSGQ